MKILSVFKAGVLILAAYLFCLNSLLGQSAIYSSEAIHHPVISKQGMVSTQNEIATDVGLSILEAGGNAIDAAVAVGFALAVVLPRAGNLGGGGFMIYHDAQNKNTHALNYRECAPFGARGDMYWNPNGSVNDSLFNHSYLSTAVPGTVKGLLDALEKYGTLSREEILAPAILLAEDGFPISEDLANTIKTYEDRLKRSEDGAQIFFDNGVLYRAGDLLIQNELAQSLKLISREGSSAFYEGSIAKKIVEDYKAKGGILSLKDFKEYQIEWSDPLWGSYKNYQIASMPPPSSGGVHLIQMLNMLENYDLKSMGHNSAAYIHILAEVMRLAYADRSEHLGDPQFWKVPLKGLISKAYANDISKLIHEDQANLSSSIKAGKPQAYESPETTHYSIIDKDGNVVSNTYTLNFSFGSGIVAKGTGILMNNEMGDFSAKPGVPNAYGLIGNKANEIAARKRPLSSMTPTIIFKEEEAFLVTGTPGGSRIITTVLQIILNVIEHDMNIAEATHALRFHHQWYPDLIYHEKGLNHDTQILLGAKGHVLKQRKSMGSTQSIMIKDQILQGASDPRRPDGKTKGY